MAGPHGLTRQSGPSAQDGNNNLGPYLNRVVWSLAALSGLFLGLRVYCKLLRRRQLWWDDHFLIASWVALVVSVAMQSAAVARGLGIRNLYTMGILDAESVTAVSLYSICAGFGSILATCWSKISFAISLLRISTGRMRWFIWFIILSVNLVFASNGAIQWAQCWPVQKRWYWDMEGSCFDSSIIQNYNTFVAAFSGLMDILLALLPWKIIWTVAINKREKLGALVAMSAGVIAGLMAFLKIKTLYVIGDDNATTVDLFIFGTAEPATAIMAASIPILRTLIRREPQPKPAQFIELADSRRKTTRPPALEPPSDGDGETQQSAEESWTKVSHLEQARVRGYGDRGV
ncbi:hypothetical protein C8A01DRAFT_48028 [Parachaetomium inaequale]|uniref:Rhodopsin domain-containing protein n=1 Tax=Parachaetomium inaequale TaxID=2588326 RepID=A0AAN6PFK6_9PEZI|nr:hypothetical protein C8A01DRAFT_48028 [Parachaetomium inaequale]